MPYGIKLRNGRHCVIKTETNSVIPGGCHDDRDTAVSHLRAIEANVTTGQKISSRERQIALHVIFGHTNHAIGHKLSISKYTVNNHLRNIYEKVGCSCRGELLVKMLLRGYLRLEDIHQFDKDS